jgi:hypothetical protein
MTTLKTTYNSNVMFSDEDGKHLVFDLSEAKVKFEGREVQIMGQWCPLFIQPVSKTTCKVGAQFRGVNIPLATGLRKAPVAAPKAPKATKSLASDLGVPEIESSEDAMDRELGLTGN